MNLLYKVLITKIVAGRFKKKPKVSPVLSENKKRVEDVLHKTEDSISKVSSISFNILKFLLLIFSLIIVCNLIVSELFSSKIVLRPFQVPKVLQEAGYTEAVFTRLVLDEINQNINTINEEKENQEMYFQTLNDSNPTLLATTNLPAFRSSSKDWKT